MTVPMTRNQRLRRAGILCCHFLRNLAFYKAGWQKNELIYRDDFWVNVNGNFLDICIIEWCKLFGEKNGKHYWKKVITNQQPFLGGLLNAVGLTREEFDAYIEHMRIYRDKFVAHLDSEDRMNIPELKVARKSISFLYCYLLTFEDKDNCLFDAPRKASHYYKQSRLHGREVYSKRSRIVTYNDLNAINP